MTQESVNYSDAPRETEKPSPAARLSGARAYSTIRSRRKVKKNETAITSAPTT